MNLSFATITNVTLRINERNQVFAHITFANQFVVCEHDFMLTRTTELKRIEALMNYTNTLDDITLLRGKTVRILTDTFLRYIGSATEDRFFSVASQEFVERSYSQL